MFMVESVRKDIVTKIKNLVYASEIWGYKEYECIKTNQLKSSRVYLEIPKQTHV